MKKEMILSIAFIVIILAISGCIENTKANSTWGEKKISIDALEISDNTTGNRSETNDSKYYVNGYIINNNNYDAINVKVKITAYVANGTVFAVNTTPYLNPASIPAKGESFFHACFLDLDKKIVRYNVEILDAKGEYWT